MFQLPALQSQVITPCDGVLCNTNKLQTPTQAKHFKHQRRQKGAGSKGGASIYVRGQPGSDGNVQFKLDLFKKFRKKDKKGEDSKN